MSEFIIGREENPNKIICPHCHDLIQVELVKFKDINKVLKDKCPKCGGENFIAVLILSDKNIDRLNKNIQTIAEVLKPVNKLFGGKRVQ